MSAFVSRHAKADDVLPLFHSPKRRTGTRPSTRSAELILHATDKERGHSVFDGSRITGPHHNGQSFAEKLGSTVDHSCAVPRLEIITPPVSTYQRTSCGSTGVGCCARHNMLRGLVLLSCSRNLKFRLAAVRSVVNVLKKQVMSHSRFQGRSGLRVDVGGSEGNGTCTPSKGCAAR